MSTLTLTLTLPPYPINSIPTGRKWVDPLLIFAHINYVTFLQNNEETGCNMEGGVNELEEIEEIELQ